MARMAWISTLLHFSFLTVLLDGAKLPRCFLVEPRMPSKTGACCLHINVLNLPTSSLFTPCACCFRWNSSTMRRWLKENNLAPGTGRAKGGNMMVSLDDLANPHIGMTDNSQFVTSSAPHFGGVSPASAGAGADSLHLGAVGGASTSRMPAHLRPPLIITEDTSKESRGAGGMGMASLLNVPLPSPTVQVSQSFYL
jgi:hypothetical protein